MLGGLHDGLGFLSLGLGGSFGVGLSGSFVSVFGFSG